MQCMRLIKKGGQGPLSSSTLMACDVPVVSQPVPVVHVPDATVAAHGEPVSVAEAAEWTGITVDAF